jgi:hypothetical protein
MEAVKGWFRTMWTIGVTVLGNTTLRCRRPVSPKCDPKGNEISFGPPGLPRLESPKWTARENGGFGFQVIHCALKVAALPGCPEAEVSAWH